MLTRSLVVAAMLASCSSGAKGPPARPPEPRPVEPVVVTPPPDAAPPELAADQLCAKVVEKFDESARGMDRDVVDRALQVVRDHCPRWPEAVQRCLATTPDADHQGPCMKQLSDAQMSAFRTDVFAAMKGPPACDDLDFDPDPWLGAPTPPEPSAKAALQLALRASCTEWSDAVRACVAQSADRPHSCLDADGVPKSIGVALDAALARRIDLFTRAAAFKATDKKIACDKVVTAHYGDARWKTKLPGESRARRKRLIKASAAAFAKACKIRELSVFTRGCVVAASSEEERGWCLDREWGYPAAALVPAPGDAGTGIPECDAYVALVDKFAHCDKVPRAAAEAAQQGIDALRAAWGDVAHMTEDSKKMASDACKTGSEALTAAAKAMDCPP